MFHNELLYRYRALVQEAESAERAEWCRDKLVVFLTRSQHYIPEQILVHFPHDGGSAGAGGEGAGEELKDHG